MTTTQSSAISAALAVAREQGLHVEEPVVLRAAWHVLVHLRPSPVVARASSALPFPEGPHSDDVVRELAVASHAARAGAPVVPPAPEVEAVPYNHGGHVVTFWRYIEPHDDPDPRAAGAALRAIHDALADCNASLPPIGHPRDMHAMLDALPPSVDSDLLREIVDNAPDVNGQALHGDAHLFNVLGSPAGPLWHDFETACHGPREYDLAALVAVDRTRGDQPSRDALAAYGAHDAELLEEMLRIYVAWITASMLTALPRRPELAEAADTRLRWLRR